MSRTSLIYTPKVLPNASFRLLCFSYAGGHSGTFIPWSNHLPESIELSVVQLPGRGIRFSESNYQNLKTLVLDLFNAYNRLDKKPTFFFGHSMGARVAFELLVLLRRFQAQLPVHFIASASAAPSIPRDTHFHTLSDEDFILRLGEINGAPKEGLSNPEIAALALPSLRSDFKIIETSQCRFKGKMPISLSILAGDNDSISHDNLAAWKSLFQESKAIRWIKGGHFFVEENRLETLKTLLDEIQSIIRTCPA